MIIKSYYYSSGTVHCIKAALCNVVCCSNAFSTLKYTCRAKKKKQQQKTITPDSDRSQVQDAATKDYLPRK